MHIIYVDDEKPAIKNFEYTVEGMENVESLHTFQEPETAIAWIRDNSVDVAFLDVEMSNTLGIDVAKSLKEINGNIRIIFVTAYSQYALDAFGVDAIGYVLKPYSRAEIQKELQKAQLMLPLPQKRVSIQTIPEFSLIVDGKPVHMGRTKTEELLALIVDRGANGITSGEAIAYLWPDRPADSNTQSLFRVTFKRMMEFLSEIGIPHIIASKGKEKYIVIEEVDCDLYHILDGDLSKASVYAGEYMRTYSWAEERNAQLHNILKI